MNSWRDRILSEFTPGAARLTLVADPDGLLLEEGVLAAVRERGFDLLAFDDPVAFRYAYESGFRSRWDRGEGEDLAVVLRFAGGDLDALPHDLLQGGPQVVFQPRRAIPRPESFSSGCIGPRGSRRAVRSPQKSGPGRAGRERRQGLRAAACLRHRAGDERTTAGLLRMLLRRH